MPILNRDDAVEVESRIERIFAAPPAERAGEIRRLFAEVLDFNLATGESDSTPRPAARPLPASAARVAALDGVHVLYVALDTTETDRVRKGDVPPPQGRSPAISATTCSSSSPTPPPARFT